MISCILVDIFKKIAIFLTFMHLFMGLVIHTSLQGKVRNWRSTPRKSILENSQLQYTLRSSCGDFSAFIKVL
ncbi:hypothetical protein H8356DRAFT_1347572 [Neocallimastix lanati (nom. inval.)]|nr:hypothetical protein H8356DRAFT_1347572 [Neocallimastix sp. JGI-2020a]